MITFCSSKLLLKKLLISRTLCTCMKLSLVKLSTCKNLVSLFSSNVSTELKVVISDILNVRTSIKENNHLGLPSFMGKSKKSVFNYLKDRVWSKVEGWDKKLLSKASKDIMIKSVVHSIPFYCISCFIILKTLCEEIQRMLNNFWWSSNSREKKGIKWYRWEAMCLTKDKWGMGFKNLHGFNLPLLGKHCWNFISKPIL